MYTDEKHKELSKILDQKYAPVKRNGSSLSSTWEELAQFVRPVSAKSYSGRQRPDIFDGTAIQALESFSAGVHSQLISPVERWFSLTIAGKSEADIGNDEALWLETASDAIYSALALPRCGFDTAMSEFFSEIGALGTACVYQEELTDNKGCRFQAIPMHSIKCLENSRGLIDTVYREYSVSARQMKQEWPWLAQHERLSKIEDDAQREVVHAVFPVSDGESRHFYTARNHAAGHQFVSVYWMPSEQVILSVGGYRTQPYHVARWKKRAGETYGDGPGHVALPDIKMVNAMSREMIIAAEQANKPPLLIDDDSMLSPIKHIVPGSILTVQPGSRLPTPLMSGSQPQLALEEMDSRRKVIEAAFFVDLFFRGKKKERQSVLEIQDDRSELTKQLTPMFGRLQIEALTPIIVRTLDILIRHGRVQPPKQNYGGFNPLDIEYTNAATKSQLHGKAFAIGQLFADLAPMAQVDPTILKVIDWREAAYAMATARDVPVRLIRSREDIDAEKKAEQEAQAQQIQMQNANMAGQTLKNVAQARAVDPTSFIR